MLATTGPARLLALSWVPPNSGLGRTSEFWGVSEEFGVPTRFTVPGGAAGPRIDVTACECDFFARTARKFLRCPVGCLLYCRQALARGELPPMWTCGSNCPAPEELALSADSRAFETGIPYASCSASAPP